MVKNFHLALIGIGSFLITCLVPASVLVAQEVKPPILGQVRGNGPARMTPYPDPDAGYVTDFADLLNQSEEEAIEQRLYSLEEASGVEMAVVTIRSRLDYPGTENASIESFARALFNRYGIGNLPKNDGILLLVAKDDRESRIELGLHYGRTKDRPASEIMESAIVPQFREGNYARGIEQGVDQIIKRLVENRASPSKPMAILTMVGLMSALLGLGLIAYSLFKNGKNGWGWVVVGLMIVLVLFLAKLFFALLQRRSRGSSGSWGSGGFGGGFGGGSSGGGGASGKW